MNRSKFIVLLLGVIVWSLTIPAPAHSQSTEIVLSDKQELIDGNLFYIHIVRKGQTLYSIARAYHVTLPEVAEFNPTVFDGLSLNQEILIPVIRGKNNFPDEIAYRNEFNFHYIEPGETLYSILNRYETKLEIIQYWNPGFEEPIKPGNRIRIPKSGVDLQTLKTRVFEEEEADVRVDVPPIVAEGNFSVYAVQKGETLYSLSKRFEVPLATLIELNPSVEDGLSIGELLRIPEPETTPLESGSKPKSENNDPGETRRTGMLSHKIEQGETLYAICKRYGVPMDSMIHYNPWAAEDFKEDRVLKIPKPGMVNPDEVLQGAVKDSLAFAWQDEKYFYHRVEKGETVYSITKFYRIKERKLKRANRDIDLDELKVNDVLQIPKKDVKDLPVVSKLLQQKHSRPTGLPQIEQLVKQREQKEDPCARFEYNPARDTFQLSLLLPFYLFENDTLHRNAHERMNQPVNNPKDSPEYQDVNYNPNLVYNKSRVMLEFYQGFLLGLADKKQDGCNVDLNVYDTGNRLDSLIHLLANPDLQEQDLIVGPVYEQNLHEFNKFSKAYAVNFVSPLMSSPHDWLAGNPHFIQVIPAMETQIRDFSQILANYHYKNIVLLHYGSEAEWEVVQMFEKYLIPFLEEKAAGDSIHVKAFQLNREKAFDMIKPRIEDDREYFDHPIKEALREDIPNLIILSSRDRGIVSNTFRFLNTVLMEQTSDYEITLAGFPNARNFDNIDQEYFHSLQYHTFSTFHVDYARAEVQDFVVNYRKQFLTEPNQFAFQGYDLAHYFLSLLMEYGPDFRDCLDDVNLEAFNIGLQNEFYYKAIADTGGIENQHISVLMYTEDYDINRIDTLFRREEKDFRSTLPAEFEPDSLQQNEQIDSLGIDPNKEQNLRLYRRPD